MRAPSSTIVAMRSAPSLPGSARFSALSRPSSAWKYTVDPSAANDGENTASACTVRRSTSRAGRSATGPAGGDSIGGAVPAAGDGGGTSGSGSGVGTVVGGAAVSPIDGPEADTSCSTAPP